MPSTWKNGPLYFFKVSNNLYEEKRTFTKGAYFFPIPKVSVANTRGYVQVLEDDAKESLTYSPLLREEMGKLKTFVGDDPMDCLIDKNDYKGLRKLVRALINERIASAENATGEEREKIVKHLIDLLFVVGKTTEAVALADKFEVKHDIIYTVRLGEKEEWNLNEVLSMWSAYCLYPLSQAVAGFCIADFVGGTAILQRLAEHGHFLNAREATIIACTRLKASHPIAAKIACQFYDEKRRSSFVIDAENLEQLKALREQLMGNISSPDADLLSTYRLLLCLADPDTRTNISPGSEFHSQLRKIWIASLTRDFVLATALAEDICARTSKGDAGILKDMFNLGHAMADLVNGAMGIDINGCTVCIKYDNMVKLMRRFSITAKTVYMRDALSEDPENDKIIAGHRLVEEVFSTFYDDVLSMESNANAFIYFKLAWNLTRIVSGLDPNTALLPDGLSESAREKLVNFFSLGAGELFWSHAQNQRFLTAFNADLPEPLSVDVKEKQGLQADAHISSFFPEVTYFLTADWPPENCGQLNSEIDPAWYIKPAKKVRGGRGRGGFSRGGGTRGGYSQGGGNGQRGGYSQGSGNGGRGGFSRGGGYGGRGGYSRGSGTAGAASMGH